MCNCFLLVLFLFSTRNLKKLNLFGTTRIKDRETAIKDLQRTIPDCDVTD
jgi:hypothetical protein